MKLFYEYHLKIIFDNHFSTNNEQTHTVFKYRSSIKSKVLNASLNRHKLLSLFSPCLQTVFLRVSLMNKSLYKEADRVNQKPEFQSFLEKYYFCKLMVNA